MNWLAPFEILILVFSLFTVVRLVMKKRYARLIEYITGSIFGLLLELVNVFLYPGSYHYNMRFVVSVGVPPHNVPIVIALAWGLILIFSLDIAGKLNVSKLKTAAIVACTTVNMINNG